MFAESVESRKPVVAPEKPADLSELIARTLERRSDERIRVIRLFNDCYRCNWWVQDAAPHPHWLLTGTIRKSRFIRAELKGDRLVIKGNE